MPHSSEQAAEEHSLPSAELNPLINPLLAENMGRWAEVYFTTPPESREQAVMELLHELQADKARRESALASELAAQPPLSRCENCGYDNPGINKFCGMCGASTSADADRHVEHRAAAATNGNGQGLAHVPEPQEWSEPLQSSDEEVYAAPRHELSLFQAYRETNADDGSDWNYEPAPSSSSRWYIGAVLLLLILGLGYMAWRQMQNSQTSHGVSAPPPVAAQQAPPEPPREDQPVATKSDTPDTAANKPTDSDPATAAPKQAAKANADEPAKEPSTAPAPTAKAAPAARPEPTTSSDRVSAPAPPADRGGAEELVVAQRYLNGANGQGRDTAEAAKWLWKSIAKHNGQATLLLADLYLKGNGVPKNCDQARILLDSAARKGISGAGERLRNLPAFGCQ
ncbi:MAG: hypothetical protein ACJ72H_13030 [Candidatus Sulfotelmatobacter sp.]